MQLKPDSEEALNTWVGPSTWYTEHDLDMDRWYDFVNQYQKDHGFTIDEASLREVIERRVEGAVNDQLDHIIRDRISLASNVLDFLKRTGR
ncbi:MAG: hypothetical protein V1800_14290 [Candidatus Latescibacterota bacterium]